MVTKREDSIIKVPLSFEILNKIDPIGHLPLILKVEHDPMMWVLMNMVCHKI